LWNTGSGSEGSSGFCTATRKENDVHVRTPLIALGAAIVPLVGLTASAGSTAATGPAQIRITDLQVSYHVVRPSTGNAAGSIEIIRQRLYNPTISEAPIGRATMMCTYADRRERSCTATYTLPKGEIVVTGAIQSRLLYEIPVVGGTRLFDNARGSLTVTSTHLRPRREVLVFRLAG
jgi:hypothetical protein